ncbi:MAG: outer membrane lipoprotein-sorting protein [Candidatus Omnitrophica bacterium]|nr:outer membrane lipoprotein-sorting protein [Candidatus Omnitrophota bacterium]
MPRKLSKFLFLILFFCSIPAFAENQVRNPDMEAGQPIGWSGSASTTSNKTLYTSDSYHSGTRALKIINTVLGISNWKGNLVSFKAGAYPKKIYYSAWVKGENISSGSLVYLYLVVTFTDNRTQIINDLVFPTGTYNWTQLQLNRTFSKAVKSFRPYLYFSGGTGTAWFDDLTVGTTATNNFAQNPDMEQSKPNNWTSYIQAPNQAVYAADSFHSGSRSLKIINLLSRASYWKADPIYFSKPYPKQFTASSWAKGLNISSGSIVSMYFKVIFENNSTQAFYADNKFSSGTYDWTQKQTTKTFTRGIRFIQPYLYFSAGKGVVWFDGLSLSTTVNSAPQITNIAPADNSDILLGAKVNITATASDADNDPLEYQFSITGTIKQAWSSANTYAWQTTEADLGLSSVTCDVRDNKGGTASKTISLRVINPTVEEILQKVADNYAKIYDLKADMTLTSTLNGEPFGQTGYCRYFFKAPNKENTETFSDATRATKTEAVITDSSNMHLIDHLKKTTQSIDLLTEVGISSDQFNQMDLYYNQSNFLNNHTITKNPETSDLGNFIIALEAVPKTENEIYTKLGLYIDYNKGLLSKIVYYKNDELPQILEAQETKQIPNGAWVVSVLKKTPNLKAGNLIITLTYTDLQINSGLSDSIFDPTKQY